MAKRPTIPRRTQFLAVLLGVVAVWAFVHWIRTGEGPLGGSGSEEVEYAMREVPELLPMVIGTPAADLEESARNPFAYGPPPTPTPNLTPRPTRPPVPTRPPRPTPTPFMVNGVEYPPPPPFDRKYLGFLGPDRSRVAVFRKGEDLEIAIVGGVLKNDRGMETFIVREAWYDSVLIGFVGYPEEVTAREALEEK